jgi:hypothetical protein
MSSSGEPGGVRVAGSGLDAAFRRRCERQHTEGETGMQRIILASLTDRTILTLTSGADPNNPRSLLPEDGRLKPICRQAVRREAVPVFRRRAN